MRKMIIAIAVFILSTNAFGYYQAKQGRWLSRDPIGEKGGENIYCFVYNAPIQFYDPIGKSAYIESGPYYRHWLWGGGNPMFDEFTRWDPGFQPKDFDKFDGSKVCGSDSKISINMVKLHDTNGAVGQIDVRLTGTLSYNKEECEWRFTGIVSIDPNDYDFDWKEYGQRDRGGWFSQHFYPKENATRFGRIWGGPDSSDNDYTIHFIGNRVVETSGDCNE